jgi:putative SOS response-associated peptidase YedK
VCNLYSLTTTREAARALLRVLRDTTANQPPLPAIFPDQLAPVVRVTGDGSREMLAMRWGFPPPPTLGGRPVTNIRNLASPHWRHWLKPEWRCLVPATSFCEYTDSPPKVPHWFALGTDRPLFAFAGIWRPWIGERRKESGEHLLFSFLTCAANEVVRPVHAKAMPVLLTTPEEWETWLTGPAEAAIAMQRPLAADRLAVVATGEREDAPP